MGTNPASVDDIEIYDVVTMINAIPFLQTIFCCSGHNIWESRSNENPAYIEYEYQGAIEQGKEFTDHLIASILCSKHPLIAPRADYFEYGAKLLATYKGDLYAPPEQIRVCVNTFWDAIREGIASYRVK